ncbi:MAG: hypothetical protein EZS28_022157 [Streblomastix strix]|uniref:Uncharacterized protein n=1 Tax=Streblomastix strix TaxID=222440 RepID=A0A5J4VIS1_9EUKA|nr:MAG: hypothetical protein EZS28_022157 [Streblomastix strix]
MGQKIALERRAQQEMDGDEYKDDYGYDDKKEQEIEKLNRKAVEIERMDKKRLMLEKINLQQTSTTRVIFPQFAEPLYFEVEFVNRRDIGVEIEVVIGEFHKRAPVFGWEGRMRRNQQINKQDLNKNGNIDDYEDESEQDENEEDYDEDEDDDNDDLDIRVDEELFVLNDEEGIYYKKLAGQSKSASNAAVEEPVGGIRKMNSRCTLGQQRRGKFIKRVGPNERVLIPLVYQSLCSGAIETGPIKQERLGAQSQSGIEAYGIKSVGLDQYTQGECLDPWGVAIGDGITPKRRLVEVCIVDRQNGYPLTVTHVVVCPTNHGVDRTMRVYRAAGEAASFSFEIGASILADGTERRFVKRAVLGRTRGKISAVSRVERTSGAAEVQTLEFAIGALKPFRPYRFEIAMFSDEACGLLFEVWEVIVYGVPGVSIQGRVGEPVLLREVLRSDEEDVGPSVFFVGPQMGHVNAITRQEIQSSSGSERDVMLLMRSLLPGRRMCVMNMVEGVKLNLKRLWLVETRCAEVASTKRLKMEMPIEHSATVELIFNNPFTAEKAFALTTDLWEVLELPAVYTRLDGGAVGRIGVRVAALFRSGAVTGRVFVCGMDAEDDKLECVYELTITYTEEQNDESFKMYDISEEI